MLRQSKNSDSLVFLEQERLNMIKREYLEEDFEIDKEYDNKRLGNR